MFDNLYKKPWAASPIDKNSKILITDTVRVILQIVTFALLNLIDNVSQNGRSQI